MDGLEKLGSQHLKFFAAGVSVSFKNWGWRFFARKKTIIYASGENGFYQVLRPH